MAKSRIRGESPAAQPLSSHLTCDIRACPLRSPRIPASDETRREQANTYVGFDDRTLGASSGLVPNSIALKPLISSEISTEKYITWISIETSNMLTEKAA